MASHANGDIPIIMETAIIDDEVEDETKGGVENSNGVENEKSVKFTVTRVKNDLNRVKSETEVSRLATRNHLTPFDFQDSASEPSDTLVQNSITALLSSKFRDISKRIRQYGDTPRFRKRLVSKWESLDYDLIESELQAQEEETNKSKRKLTLMFISRWIIMFAVGIGTALLAAGVQISVEIIAHEKFHLIQKYIDRCSTESCTLFLPIGIWVVINVVITLLGAALVTYVQPVAAGSGIPFIKSYLNGVRIPGLLNFKAFIAKTLGVILSILGGLACGKEGPMAHSGGIMAAGFAKGRMRYGKKKEIKFYDAFRSDHEIRDFVAAGAASGVSAAFGAPVGGTLFSVEEAASFWNTELVWRVFFSAMVACFSTNFLLSAFEGHPTHLSSPGLVRFSTFQNLSFDLIEIPVFLVMAVIGGLAGALFVVLNYKLTVFRRKYIRRKWLKVLEAGIVSLAGALLAFLLMYSVDECTEVKHYSDHAITAQMFCKDKSHNSMSSLFLTTPEGCLKALLHDPHDAYGVIPLTVFIVVFFLLGVWTYGLSVSSGVFIPSLAIGAAWGRLIGLGVVELFPHHAKDVGKYALIGAASMLGGILRTTISLTVIIVECTGDISFGLPIMLTLMISKWVGDFFTTGLYDMNVEVSGIPLLSWEPPPLCENIKASEVMSQPVLSLHTEEKVGSILEILESETYGGFPVVETNPKYRQYYSGKLKGLILKNQLLVLLKKKIFAPEGMLPPEANIRCKDFDNPYPVGQRLTLKDIEVTEEEKEHLIDLKPYMNFSPYTVGPSFSMPRVFKLFRGLGLRHLIVVNNNYEPVGMVTRKDLAKYRAESKRGMLKVEHLKIENV
ncbi:H(+)/Cl(-) exchange transporter 7 isoform X1 [Patella vulgata]|uniref:H(+)/Cl(-) exchange transporter 7 isoform X1 n=2 Tax=Patella vulgata TaxID=6465 RepID=UPI00217F7BF1|nr:H(+)/Cl(-) exchange transporter 7 isoform X1 [Patella vulgata]